MLKIGDLFPKFELENQNGELITNENIMGEKTILYFYPRDNTPTCTTEACDFRDNIQYFNDMKVKVYGISGDSRKKHENFIKKHHLNFDLLVDDEFKLSNAVGIYRLKKSFGKENKGIVRTTFVIDEAGYITNIIEKVKVKTQIDELKQMLE
ncbi:peroxiredoxin [Staphylococcus hominis]|uniref:peroxiredoxin n=1 Tax=Staphylococcus hominis TaxID=1290 RepID=UPI0028799CD2|nr:peroxiredoxin [Staphylococcus hominis]MDS3837659.1 peroxiredoxin [Staphylococcus hominis]